MTPEPSPKTIPVRPWLWRICWPVLLASTIFLASGQSEVAAPPGIPHLDKIVHFGVFGLLSTLALRVFFDLRHPLRTTLIAIAIVSVYGISDEFRQSFTPGRSVEFVDWAADTTGAALAAALYSFWPGYRRLLETSIWRRAVHPAEHRAGVAAAAAAVRPAVADERSP